MDLYDIIICSVPDDGIVLIPGLNRYIHVLPSITLDLVAQRVATTIGGPSHIAKRPCNYNAVTQETKGQLRAFGCPMCGTNSPCMHYLHRDGQGKLSSITESTVKQHHDLIPGEDNLNILKYIFEPPIDRKHRVFTINEKQAWIQKSEGPGYVPFLQTASSLEKLIKEILDQYNVPIQTIKWGDLSKDKLLNKIEWHLKMHGVVSVNSIEEAFCLVSHSSSTSSSSSSKSLIYVACC